MHQSISIPWIDLFQIPYSRDRESSPALEFVSRSCEPPPHRMSTCGSCMEMIFVVANATCGTALAPIRFPASTYLKSHPSPEGTDGFLAETENRTRYLRITSAPLCQVSYLGNQSQNIHENGCFEQEPFGKKDLNHPAHGWRRFFATPTLASLPDTLLEIHLDNGRSCRTRFPGCSLPSGKAS